MVRPRKMLILRSFISGLIIRKATTNSIVVAIRRIQKVLQMAPVLAFGMTAESWL